MSDSFTGELWQGITDIYGAILAHPFLTGLTDGSLADDAFAFYVVQDALYLQRYAAALAAVASRAPDPAGTEMFARHAADAVAVEQTLHGSLLADLGIDPATADVAEAAPTNLAYTSYLLATISAGSYVEGVGAVLPCYWIYWEVGKELLRRGSPDPRYQRWIDLYGSEEFGDVVKAVLAVTDELGSGLAPAERARVHRHFRTTSRYEWMFWDMGYRKESWPLLCPSCPGSHAVCAFLAGTSSPRRHPNVRPSTPTGNRSPSATPYGRRAAGNPVPQRLPEDCPLVPYCERGLAGMS